MPRRYRPRPRSELSRSVADVSRMSWRGALLMAVAAFLIFYMAAPAALHAIGDSQSLRESYLRPLTEMVVTRRIHWVERLGLALTIACLIIAAWKAATARGISSDGQWYVRLISKLLGRGVD